MVKRRNSRYKAFAWGAPRRVPIDWTPQPAAPCPSFNPRLATAGTAGRAGATTTIVAVPAEHRDERTLNEFVLQRGNTQRTLPIGTRLGNQPSPYRQRPISAAMDSCVQLLKVTLKSRLVVLPCHAVNPGSGSALEREERHPQQIDGDVVQQAQ